mmetsp:Transcript_45512/g.89637  ORF Transcript_45512/g.89637 Transcript_45512/m.89637 type:complete len:273 (+) Transcript_45512:333-1151(+)
MTAVSSASSSPSPSRKESSPLPVSSLEDPQRLQCIATPKNPCTIPPSAILCSSFPTTSFAWSDDTGNSPFAPSPPSSSSPNAFGMKGNEECNSCAASCADFPPGPKSTRSFNLPFAKKAPDRARTGGCFPPTTGHLAGPTAEFGTSVSSLSLSFSFTDEEAEAVAEAGEDSSRPSLRRRCARSRFDSASSRPPPESCGLSLVPPQPEPVRILGTLLKLRLLSVISVASLNGKGAEAETEGGEGADKEEEEEEGDDQNEDASAGRGETVSLGR